MASIVWSDVEAHAPALSTVASGAQTDILAHVNTILNVSLFGGESAAKLKLARIYLAAHSGTLSLLGASGASGPVTKDKAGGLERSYATASPTLGTDYSTTIWGQLFIQLSNTTAARAGMLI